MRNAELGIDDGAASCIEGVGSGKPLDCAGGDNPGLYVHVPFCRRKCPYCDFYSVARVSLIPEWLRAIEREILFYRKDFGAFDSLYFGGGTPSLLEEGQLGSLLEYLFRSFRFHDDLEITLEANPDDLNPSNLRAIKALGINRLSVGVQSFDEDDLRYLGRRHTADQTLRVLDWVRSAGFENVGIDLIFGFEAQNGKSPMATWETNLERALAFNPEHLSCYQMTYEDSTLLGKQLARGAICRLDKEEEAELFLFASEYLENHGYIHYEVSNFAWGTNQMSRHNTKYWRHAPYLGLGPSAHSFQNGVRWWNTRSLRDYCRLTSLGERPVAGSETLTLEQIKLEALFLGARTRSGFSIDSILDRSNSEPVLAKLRSEGVVVTRGNRVIPTRKGLLVADSLPLLFS